MVTGGILIGWLAWRPIKKAVTDWAVSVTTRAMLSDPVQARVKQAVVEALSTEEVTLQVKQILCHITQDERIKSHLQHMGRKLVTSTRIQDSIAMMLHQKMGHLLKRSSVKSMVVKLFQDGFAQLVEEPETHQALLRGIQIAEIVPATQEALGRLIIKSIQVGSRKD